MEDKHIYSTSFLSKLQDKFGEFAEETKNIIQSIIPKREKKKSPTVSMEPLVKEVPKTPVITTSASEIKAEQPKIKKIKVKKPKKERVKKFHYRKIADERVQKTLVISLAVAIISIFGAGAYLTHKDILNPQNPTKNIGAKHQISPTPVNNATEGWKTYKNEEYKYELKYPIAWEIITTNNRIDLKEEGSPLIFNLTIEELVQEKEGFINDLISLNENKENTTVIKESSIRIGTLNTLQIKKISEKATEIDLFAFHSESYVAVSFLYTDPQRLQTITQILSTFKFFD